MAKQKTFTVPIYEVEVTVVVAENIKAEYEAMKHYYGIENTGDSQAMVVYKGWRFGLFFEIPASQRLPVVAHETFHLTHRILEYCRVNFDSDNHEAAAYLHEYLICQILKFITEVTPKAKL